MQIFKVYPSVLISILILMSGNASAQAFKKLKYNQKESVSFNEKQFLANLQYDCEHYGYNRKIKEKSPADILATYPKELSILYLNKHYKNLCYYSVSTVLKSLISDFKAHTQKIVTNIVEDCLTGERKHKVCEDINSKASLFDLTILLGSYCNRKTLQSFKIVNCEYKKLAENECKLFNNVESPLRECPYEFANKSEINELHKSYFGKHCKGLRWRRPKCLE